MKVWALLLLIGLAGCYVTAYDRGVPQSILDRTHLPHDGKHKLTDASRAKCLKEGGTPQRIGWSGEVCMRFTPDVGKSCSDSAQCEGVCIAETKSCSKTEIVFGCYTELRNGKAVEGPCLE